METGRHTEADTEADTQQWLEVGHNRDKSYSRICCKCGLGYILFSDIQPTADDKHLQ
jgi:hypothetical protein